MLVLCHKHTRYLGCGGKVALHDVGVCQMFAAMQLRFGLHSGTLTIFTVKIQKIFYPLGIEHVGCPCTNCT